VNTEENTKRTGGVFAKAGAWAPYVIRDGLQIGGQNSASPGPTVERPKKALGKA